MNPPNPSPTPNPRNLKAPSNAPIPSPTIFTSSSNVTNLLNLTTTKHLHPITTHFSILNQTIHHEHSIIEHSIVKEHQAITVFDSSDEFTDAEDMHKMVAKKRWKMQLEQDVARKDRERRMTFKARHGFGDFETEESGREKGEREKRDGRLGGEAVDKRGSRFDKRFEEEEGSGGELRVIEPISFFDDEDVEYFQRMREREGKRHMVVHAREVSSRESFGWLDLSSDDSGRFSSSGERQVNKDNSDMVGRRGRTTRQEVVDEEQPLLGWRRHELHIHAKRRGEWKGVLGILGFVIMVGVVCSPFIWMRVAS